MAVGKKMKKGRRKKEKKGEKGGEKGKNEVKMGEIYGNMGKNRFFSHFFPKRLQISIFFPHHDIMMGKKYENLLKYPKKFPRGLRAQKNWWEKIWPLKRGGGN